MRSISDAEARTVRSLLAALPLREGERARLAGVSSRTFERTRRRAYEAGWLYDRYIPNPAQFGFTTVTFVLVHPFAEDLSSVARRMMDISSNVLLWSWPSGVFAVFLTRRNDVEHISDVAKWRDAGGTIVLSCSASGEGVPAYFDFEGAWVRWTGQAGVLSYPRGLPQRGSGSPRTDLEVVSTLPLVNALIGRSFDSQGNDRPIRASPSLLRRKERQMVREGLVERRTFLNPKRIPPFQGRSMERFAFVTGDLCDRQTGSAFLRALFSIGVTPFLFASDGSRVLLGSMSPGPPRPLSGANQPAVLRTLSRYISNIRISREELGSTSFLVSHRYDHLLESE